MASWKMASFFGIGIVLILAVMAYFGFGEVAALLASANLAIVFLAVLAHFFILFALAIRLRVISRRTTELSTKEALKITIAGLFVNFLTPVMKIGGEPIKILMLGRKTGNSSATAIIAMDTLIEILSSFAVFALIFLFLFDLLPGELVIYFVLFLVIITLMVLFFLKISLTQKWLEKIVNFAIKKASRFIKIEKKNYADLFSRAFRTLAKDKPTLVSAFGVSLTTKFFEIVRIWIVFAALGIFLPFDILLIVWGFLLILFIIPWLPGGLGLIEGGLAYALITLGVSKTLAASGVLLDRFISFWFVMAIGAVITSHYAWKLGDKK